MTTVNVVDETADPIVIEVFTGAPGPQGPKGDKGDQGPAGASGANGAMALIASGTVATDGGSVPLLTVPQTFNDLFLTWTAASVTTAGSVGLRFNGDGGANYDYNSQGAKTPSSGPQGAGGEENGSLISIGTSDVPGAAGSCRILGYRTPNTPRRAVLAESVYYGTATPLLSNRYSFGAWRSSAPITQIQVVAFFGGGFKAGSKFTLWGV